jgi:phosphoserine aminotransferase
MNLLPRGKSADYLVTGHWSERAVEEAQIVAASNGGTVRIAASTAETQFTRVPSQGELQLDAGAAFVHMTSNNTIYGSQWHTFPDTGTVPLVADMSSDFLWRKIDASRFAMIYAGAQKNVGPSGVTVVVMRKDLTDGGRKDIPKIFRYATHASQNSLYHTPPTFGIYLVRNVLEWIQSIGGLAQIEAWNREKGRLLYGAIDGAPDYWRCPVARESRSYMNVVFRLPNEALEEKFAKESTAAGLIGLKGHRSVGGMRASLYNAVTVDDVKKLVGFMDEFRANNRP